VIAASENNCLFLVEFFITDGTFHQLFAREVTLQPFKKIFPLFHPEFGCLTLMDTLYTLAVFFGN